MMRIDADINTVYGDLLVKSAQEITPDLIEKIRRMGDKHDQVIVPLKNTPVFADFQKVFDDARYTTMFSPPISKDEVCKAAAGLKFENDLLFELSNLKQNLPYTYYHLLIVAAFSIKLSLYYKPDEYDIETVSHCGFTHDIGKSRLPVWLLNKTQSLTAQERALIETHVITGYVLLNYYLKNHMEDCSLASLQHHEKLDGSGYPNGITDINRYTQLVTPIDVMDALMTKRPYRDSSFTLRATLDYLVKDAETGKMNKDIVLALISFARKDKPDISKIKLSKEKRDGIPGEMKYGKDK